MSFDGVITRIVRRDEPSRPQEQNIGLSTVMAHCNSVRGGCHYNIRVQVAAFIIVLAAVILLVQFNVWPNV